MNYPKIYIPAFLLEIVVAACAGLSFALIADRWTAALTAGTGFLILNLVIAALTFKIRKESVLFWWNLALLLLVTIPMIAVRALNEGTAWAELTVFGIPGPLFHRLSTSAFFIQMALTLLEGFKNKIFRAKSM